MEENEKYGKEEFLSRQAEFLASREFEEFFLPIVKARRQDHIEAYLSNGGDDHRIRVRELDDLIDDAKSIKASPDESEE